MRRIFGCIATATLMCVTGSCGEDDTTEPGADLDGAWVGSTDQNRPMEFLVENSAVVLWVVGFRAAGTTCTDDFPLIVFNRQTSLQPFAITDGVLHIAVPWNRGTMNATGEFDGDGTAAGTM